MMKNTFFRLVMMVIIISGINYSCIKDINDEDDSEELTEGPIRDKYDASSIATALGSVVDAVSDNLSTGTYTNHIVTSYSGGTASITGTKSSSYVSDYTTEYKRSLYITFENYKYLTYTFSGTVYYKLNDFNSSYSSYHLIREISGSSVSITIEYDDYTIEDICTVYLIDDDDSRYSLIGDITGKDGILYGVGY